jgi:hypothetical protein
MSSDESTSDTRMKSITMDCYLIRKNYVLFYYTRVARSSVMVKVLCYKSESREFEIRWGVWMFSIYLILQAALGPGVYSAANRNEYQKQKIMFLESRVLPVRRTENLSWFSRQCGMLNASQRYRPPRPVTGIASLIFAERIRHVHLSYYNSHVNLL